MSHKDKIFKEDLIHTSRKNLKQTSSLKIQYLSLNAEPIKIGLLENELRTTISKQAEKIGRARRSNRRAYRGGEKYEIRSQSYWKGIIRSIRATGRMSLLIVGSRERDG